MKQGRASSVIEGQPAVESFAPALRRYFAKRAPASDVGDLVQEVLARMQGRRGDPNIANLQGYVFTVAANVLKETRRKHRPSGELSEDQLALSDGITPERIVSARLEVVRLMKAIDGLPHRTREIFVAHRFEEMSYGAIARLFGISVSAVEKHMMSALRSLSASLREGG